MIKCKLSNQQLWPAIQVGPTSLMDPTLVVRRKGLHKNKNLKINHSFPFTAQNNNYMLWLNSQLFLVLQPGTKKKSRPCVMQKSDLRPFNCTVGRPQNNKQISWEAYLRIHFWIYKNQSVYKYTTKSNKFAINWMDLRFLFCFALLLLLPPRFSFSFLSQNLAIPESMQAKIRKTCHPLVLLWF